MLFLKRVKKLHRPDFTNLLKFFKMRADGHKRNNTIQLTFFLKIAPGMNGCKKSILQLYQNYNRQYIVFKGGKKTGFYKSSGIF